MAHSVAMIFSNEIEQNFVGTKDNSKPKKSGWLKRIIKKERGNLIWDKMDVGKV